MSKFKDTVKRLERYVRCTSISGIEKEMCDLIKSELLQYNASIITDENTHALDSNGYNIFASIDGDLNEEPIMLCAHLDTVNHTGEIVPIIKNGVVTSNGQTILGADDKSGVTAIMEAISIIKNDMKSHRPIEVLFTINEEIGLKGSGAFDFSVVKSKRAIVFDSSEKFGSIINQSPSANIVKVEVYGIASHAAIHPEEGISALMAAVEMIHQIKIGRIDENTTVNVANFLSPGKTNVVSEVATFEIEIRSFDEKNLEEITNGILDIINTKAALFKVNIKFTNSHVLKKFYVPEEDILIKMLSNHLNHLKIQPIITRTYGGSDTNNINIHNIIAVNLSTGMQNSHSINESIKIVDLEKTTELIVNILTGEYNDEN